MNLPSLNKAGRKLPPISKNGFGTPLTRLELTKASDGDGMVSTSDNFNAVSKSVLGAAPLSFRSQVKESLAGLHKEVGNDTNKLKQSVGLIQRLWKNVLDNPNDDKYRTVRPFNIKIRETVTRYYNGTSLLKLVGFQE